ncbi:MAG: endolytic transglycosylase MltG [Bacillota bacterium]
MEPKANVNSNKVFRIKLFYLITFLIAIVMVISYFAVEQMKLPVNKDSSEIVSVEIQPKTGTRQIARLLYEKGLIKNITFFVLYVRNEGLDRSLKAGSYELSPAMKLNDIVAELSKGRTNLISFTIPEGLTLAQTAALLEKDGIVSSQSFLDLAEHGEFNFPWIDELPKNSSRLEGFLFPDTYKIPEGYSEEKVIQMMLDRFVNIFNDEYRNQMDEMNLNIVQVVTLASIIEREIRLPGEQAIASAVFHNRLQKNMRLESCATVQYALGEVKETLLLSDLEIDSPYNTYRNSGLPPGPIAAPGKGAIHAALYPSDDDYLFFVAKPDGSHHFSRTLQEHISAKNKYLK